eukprot:c19158_g1_i1.p1 GENE.c19158_g1_i1~~c19158_g1_i1.p1  ORF type:complete len:331 (+),score=155.92 c19158_g1_i1:448-1440(+)
MRHRIRYSSPPLFLPPSFFLFTIPYFFNILFHHEFQELFGDIGPLKMAKLNYNKDGTCSGSAEIQYINSSDAQKAVEKYTNVELDGRPLVISFIASPQSLKPVSVSGGIQQRLGRVVVAKDEVVEVNQSQQQRVFVTTNGATRELSRGKMDFQITKPVSSTSGTSLSSTFSNQNNRGARALSSAYTGSGGFSKTGKDGNAMNNNRDAGRGGVRGGRGGGRGYENRRPKTIAELDSELDAYKNSVPNKKDSILSQKKVQQKQQVEAEGEGEEEEEYYEDEGEEGGEEEYGEEEYGEEGGEGEEEEYYEEDEGEGGEGGEGEEEEYYEDQTH